MVERKVNESDSALTHPMLVVEDDADLREVVCQILADSGYRPLAASNGLEALQILREAEVKPSLILLDVMMPVMDGWQFREEQRADPALADIPVVVLSAHGNPDDMALEMGADGSLRKPVDLPVLLSIVDRYCGECATVR